ncbi:MAG TPA: dTDP-4-dehydrorhamnose 3,5-epimerase [Terriglobia bacterium]|nr:dTDP-4-dehydrorhamnose 3,5-epimerase [Terriglobia bacterium]
MKFHNTSIGGAFEIDVEPIRDQRGYFARTWCEHEFGALGLNSHVAQCNISYNRKKGTLRGMHFQHPPYEEAKLVRCVRGAIYDVVLDLRRNSPTFKGWTAAVLTAKKYNMMYVPEGCAHGFLTLEDETEVFYQMSEAYNEKASSGVRWNDPAFRIVWPSAVEVISERDRSYPDFA